MKKAVDYTRRDFLKHAAYKLDSFIYLTKVKFTI
jgi:hypothetical protein